MLRYIDFGCFEIPSYGLFLCSAVFLTAFFVIKKVKKCGISFENMIIIAAVSVGSALLGGGFLYIAVTYSPGQIIGYIMSADFSFLFNTGIVFFGGLLGGISGGLVCSKILGIKYEQLESAAVPYLPLGYAFGRIGCILAGCCYGFEYHGVFAVNNEFAPYDSCFPVQAVEALMNLLIMCVLLKADGKNFFRGRLLRFYLILYSAVRFVTEFFRGDTIRGIYMGLSLSQWIAVIIISVNAVWFLCKKLYCKIRKSIV